MRKLSANYIFPIDSLPLKNGVVVIDDNGIILELQSENSSKENIEYYNGIICPGFINTHCHLELSHLKGQITEHTGLTGFIKDLLSIRNTYTPPEAIYKAIADAEKEMIKNGIVAVGDISNTDISFPQKEKKNITYHTFIELIGINPDEADTIFNKGMLLSQRLNGNKSLNPHAPYSVSKGLLSKLDSYAHKQNTRLSIHNQESKAEENFFINKTGALTGLFEELKVNINSFQPTGLNSLRSSLMHLSKCNKIILVHNTYTSREDIEWAHKCHKGVWWCLCPNANQFIENKQPDYQAFIDTNAKITIGTDSLASNHTLSILEELKTISESSSTIPLTTLLIWATLNGARFLGFEKMLGSIEKGKKPGLNLIENIDLKKLRLKKESGIRKLI